MAAIDRFILLVRDLHRDQRGIAVPTALMALIASFALASVAVMSTVDVQQGEKRDHDSKEAIAAADAGASIALLRLNRFLPTLNTGSQCVGPNGESQLAEKVSGVLWCPWTATEQVGGASFRYRVSAYSTSTKAINVVAVGTSGAVSRRVNVALKTLAGKKVFATEKVLAQGNITLEGGAYIHTDIGTNGSIENKGSAKICGNDRSGPSGEAPTPECGVKTKEIKNLPPVVAPENIKTENDNCRLAWNCTGAKAGQKDTYSTSGNGNKPVSSSEFWEPAHRILNIGSNTQLTMGGNLYFVCELNIQGKLYMPAGAHVEIYIDTPKECGLSSGARQVYVGAGGVIESSACEASQPLCDVPRIYVLGNGSVTLVGTIGTTNEVILYAPESEVDLGGNATWKGMIAGNTLKIHGNPTIESDSKIREPEMTFASTFERTRYVECTGAVATAPNENC
jgi:hypothetical protein